MRMELSVVSKQQAELQNKSVVFVDGAPLSIGRGVDNQWVLPDDNLYLSGKHCIINLKNNRFIISDLSTNGVYLNHSETPIGRGRCAVLNNGTLIRIGDYTIRASIDESTVRKADSLINPLSESAQGSALSEMLVGQTPVDSAIKVSSSFAADHISPERVSLANSKTYNVTEPQVHLPENWLEESLIEEPVIENSSIEEPSIEESIIEKSVVDALALESPILEQQVLQETVIEDTLIDELVRAPLIKQPVTEEPDRTKPNEMIESVGAHHSEDPMPFQETVTHTLTEGDTALLTQILSTAGIDPALVTNPQEVADRLGVLIKYFANGMIQTLATRSMVKREFRLQQTMIQPTDNNPFKFSPTGREALNIALFSSSSAYLSGDQAVSDSFRDIQAHQLAMMSGVQEALMKLMERINPEILEARFNQKPRHFSGVPGLKKVNHWQEYKEFYEDLKASMRDDIQGFFIKEFGMAYEQQLKKISSDS